MKILNIKPNKNKKLKVLIRGMQYYRYPIKTHLITPLDNILKLVVQYLKHLAKPDDTIAISEKVVAITQKRSYSINKIKPSSLAYFLSKYVKKSPYGIGVSIPETMQLAIQETGKVRILFASVISAITKVFGIRGMFYRIAGRKVAVIDGPVDYAISPYNKHCSLGPKNPDLVCEKIAEILNCKTVIIDANDLGVEVLGRSNKKISKKLIKEIFCDNPLGQTNEQTPLAIVRSSDK